MVVSLLPAFLFCFFSTAEVVSKICSNAETETTTKNNGDDHSTCKFETGIPKKQVRSVAKETLLSLECYI